MRLLGHRNVTKLFEIIDEPGHDEVYLVMELVEGTDLGEPVRRRQAVPDSELRAWMRDIVLGLEHLHLHGTQIISGHGHDTRGLCQHRRAYVRSCTGAQHR